MTSPAAFESLIERFAALSTGGPGVNRLAYTQLERDAHQVFADFMSGLGLRVWVDAVGNTYSEKVGTHPGLPALATGSHLDSVPSAGKFDGIAGVVVAMLTAQWLVEESIEHRHPIRFVVFTNEEGARFGRACIGSRFAAGQFDAAELHSLVDADGISLGDAMRELGFDTDRFADATWNPDDWAAFVELHIEQGPYLEDKGVQIGIVDCISGSTRCELRFEGTAAHSGGSPMHLRADAVMAAAEFMLAAEALALDDDHDTTRITFGQIAAEPGSISTIPGACVISVDIRDTDPARQRDVAAWVESKAEAVAEARGCTVSIKPLAVIDPVQLPDLVPDAVAKAAANEGLSAERVASGASHDTQLVNNLCPAGMVFVPSLNGGVSHAPEELSRYDDLARGCDVVKAALLELDATLDVD